MQRSLREYEPIWEELKRREKVKITCASHNRKTIKKGVIKEKDKDEVYKLRYRKRLKITQVEDGLIFELIDFTPLSWILRRTGL